ncbi:MAG: hypothetical protein H5T86_04820 [Armatimonadetes bacterium]|nr:hypothetical protein [Armatimonadota bacterium]
MSDEEAGREREGAFGNEPAQTPAEAEGQDRGTEDILEVDVGPDDEDVLVVELDDEEAAPQASGLLPPVPQQALVASESLQVPAVCALTLRPFVLSVVAATGGYDVIGAHRVDGQAASALASAAGPKLHGVFTLSHYAGCPHCKAPGLLLCEDCGTISCGAIDAKTGNLLPCPLCGNAGPVTASKSGWAVQSLPPKGKKKA